VQAAAIGVGDQPLLKAEVIRRLHRVYRKTAAPIVAPRYGGNRGNPVLFDSALFPELSTVVGDQGGKPVIEAHASDVQWVDFPEALSGADVDTLADLERLFPASGG
jgi:molybdenum cofactor cytidylyltransferase